MYDLLKITILLFVCISCTAGPRPLDQVPQAKEFWGVFIESAESGDKEKLLNCFSEPHSDLVKAYADSEASQVIFIRKLLDKYGEQGINVFNDHRIVGGSVLTWPSMFSKASPKVIRENPSGFVLDNYGWKLEIKIEDDGVYRITNSQEALKHFQIKDLRLKAEVYSYGYKKLKDEDFEIEDIPSLRIEMFERLLGIPNDSFKRY